MKNIKTEVKIAIAMVLGVILMISGLLISDYAKVAFGWTVGDIMAILGLVSFVGAFGFLVAINGRNGSK